MKPRVQAVAVLAMVSGGLVSTTSPGVAAQPPPVQVCHGQTATIVGSSGNDTIQGTAGNDVIVAGKGRDSVFGGHGHDVICGGKGGDRLFGGPGNDELFGQKGGPVSDDEGSGYFLGNLIDGGGGNDLLSGGPQGDMPFYEEGTVPDRVSFGSATGGVTVRPDGTATGPGIGTDHISTDFGLINGTRFADRMSGVGIADLSAGAGNDRLVATAPKAWLDFTGGPGNDVFNLTAARRSQAFGGSGRDQILGSPGLDYVVSGLGADLVDTGGGPDYIQGVSNGDRLLLGDGNDTVVIGNASGQATYVGGSGDDHLKVEGNGRTNLLVDAARGYFRINDTRSSLSGFETFVAGPAYIRFPGGRFTFRGSDVAETVRATGGNYRKLIIQGAGGADELKVTAGPNSVEPFVYGGPGDDTITGSDQDDYLNGNSGTDTIDGRGGSDVCIAEHVTNCES